MRCIIARFAFDLTKSDVQASMKGVTPELITGDSVIISRRHYPVKQVGEVVTRQDRRDFSAAEMTRALLSLGFTCRSAAPHVPAAALSPLRAAQAMLGGGSAGPAAAQPAAGWGTAHLPSAALADDGAAGGVG